ncbi:MAG: SWIM zinc finger domain-containing protein, partial [Ferruginibacter sp.]
MNINLIAADTIKNLVSTKTTAKAKRIYENCEIVLQKTEADIFYFLCQSESERYRNYEVEIDFADVYAPIPTCDCPQHENEQFCKHVAACLVFLQESKENNHPSLHKQQKINVEIVNDTTRNAFLENSTTSYPQKYNSNNLNDWSIFYGLTAAKKYKIKDLSNNDNVSILFESQQKSLAANVLDGNKIFLVEIRK